MRKFLVLALVLLAAAGYARESSIYVGTGAETPDIYDGSPGDAYFGVAEVEMDGELRADGAVTLGDNVADVITITGSMVFGAPVSFPAGTVLLPSIYFTGDPNTGIYWIGADNFGFTVAGGIVGDFDGTGLNNCALGQTTPLAADVTTLTTTGQSDFLAGTAADPSLVFTGSLTSGLYEVAADSPGMSVATANVGTWDGAGYQGDLGQTVPGAADVTTLTTTGLTDLFAGAVGGPSVSFTGSATSGLYEIAGDNIGMAIGGALVGDFDATGLNNCPIGQTTPGAADVTTLTTTGLTDLFAGAVGAPSVFFTGSATSGLYEIAGDNIGMAIGGALVGDFDATGLNNCPIGATTPLQGDFTNLYAEDDFTYGQQPGDLHEGYARTEMIKFIDGFNMGVDVQFALIWDLTGVVGAGTNAVAATPGLNTLTTGGAGAGNTESTLSFTAHHYPAYTPRIECSMAVPVLANTEAWFGFYNAANDYVYLEYDASASANWFISADDAGGVGPDTMDTGVAVTVAAQKLEITISAAGVVDCAINNVDIDCTALGTDMTANGHQTYWRVMEEAAGATAIAVDYIEEEQLKVQ